MSTKYTVELTEQCSKCHCPFDEHENKYADLVTCKKCGSFCGKVRRVTTKDELTIDTIYRCGFEGL